jgi:hypothetical protein
MTETHPLTTEEAEGQISAALAAGVYCHVRAGMGLSAARTRGEMPGVLQSLRISELYAQVMLEAHERFEASTISGLSKREAVEALQADKAFMGRLLTHSMQNLEVSRAS